MNRRESSGVSVAILARAPVPGQAKTRLIPALGAQGAARLQAWMTQRTVDMALAAGLGPVSLWCAGDMHHPAFDVCQASGSVALRAQPQGDLGWRMLSAIRESTAAHGVLVIGTDCPALTADHLGQAAQRLHSHATVICPAQDGGYVLLGLRKPLRPTCERIFERIDWGSDRVMTQTRERLATNDERWNELPPLWDVDRPEDLPRLLALYPELSPIADQEVSP